MIVEFQDFVKWLAAQEIKFIREQYADGEVDFIDPTTGSHKDFTVLWGLVGDFRDKNGLPYICHDEDGNEITPEQYFQIIKKIRKETDGQSTLPKGEKTP